MIFPFDNSFVRELPDFGVPGMPERASQPRLLFLNRPLAAELNAQLPDDETRLAAIFSGNEAMPGSQPVAQAYAGHQFGGFSPQLGDGRALLLGEVKDVRGYRRDIAFKGSGRTKFSRNGDGKAAVGPMLREVLIGEAMQALGIPTTRALAVTATGDAVYREKILPGAVLTRVAASHIRVGTFEYFAARGDAERVRQLADYAIDRHYPELREGDSLYLNFLRAVMNRQASLIAQWMSVGFVHGVMNTDNMTISGETIDYGPCAFLERYDPRAVFSSIDRGGRYAYGNQPAIAQWNLARFAESILVLLDRDEKRAVVLATETIREFPDRYRAAWLTCQRRKLGLGIREGEKSETSASGHNDESDMNLIEDFLRLLEANSADFTLSFRELADAADGNNLPLLERIADGEALKAWLARWRAQGVARGEALRAMNPRIIPRNHRVEEALAAASDHNDLAPFNALVAALRTPYSDDSALAKYAEPASPEVTAGYRTFCGT